MTAAKLPDADRAFLRTLTLLYVEDDEAAREQMTMLLRRRVGRLIVATDGVEGMIACRRALPDLVVTDIQMPTMDGLTMAQEIRALAPTMPIIVTTAFEQSDYFLRSIEIGIDRYIVKPVDLGRLDAALTVCAHRLRAEQQLVRRRQWEADWRRQQAVALLAAGMAHDYNNMLQTILGNVSMARMLAPEVGELATLLEQAESSACEAGQLGHKLALLGNAGMHKLGAVPVVEVLRTTLHEATEDTEVASDVVLAAGVGPAVLVAGDRRLLTALFGQLAANAVDAMPQGGTLTATVSMLAVTAEAELPVAPGTYVHVEVRDTGRGIAPEIHGQIFEPYFSTKERSSVRGVGLGLAMCRAIVQRLHGHIGVDRQAPPGATFRVYLPVTPG